MCNLFAIDKRPDRMAYGTGRIQFIPNGRPNDERTYSERSIIQLQEENFPFAILRALDVENNRRV